MATASAPVPGERKSRKKEPLGVTTGTSKTGEVFTFFYGTQTPFSQFHPAQFEVKGQQYNCAEQYMMHQKAGESDNYIYPTVTFFFSLIERQMKPSKLFILQFNAFNVVVTLNKRGSCIFFVLFMRQRKTGINFLMAL